MLVGEIIKNLRKRDKYTQKDLAKKLNVADTAVSAWERNINKPLMNNIEMMAILFNVPMTLFFEENPEIPNKFDEKKKSAIKIPYIDNYNFKTQSFIKEIDTNYIYELSDTLPRGDIFAFKVFDDYMTPTIPLNSTVLIRAQSEVEDGEIAAVQLKNTTRIILLRFKQLGESSLFIPDNRAHDSLLSTKDQPIHIVGKVISLKVTF